MHCKPGPLSFLILAAGADVCPLPSFLWALFAPQRAEQLAGHRQHQHDAKGDGHGDLQRFHALRHGLGVHAHDEIINRVIDARAGHQRKDARRDEHDGRAAPGHGENAREQGQRNGAQKRGRHHRGRRRLHPQPIHHPACHTGEAAGQALAVGRVEQQGKTDGGHKRHGALQQQL